MKLSSVSFVSLIDKLKYSLQLKIVMYKIVNTYKNGDKHVQAKLNI